MDSNNDNNNRIEMEVDRGAAGGLSRRDGIFIQVNLDNDNQQQQQQQQSDQELDQESDQELDQQNETNILEEIEYFSNFLRSRVRPRYYNNGDGFRNQNLDDIEFYGDDNDSSNEEQENDSGNENQVDSGNDDDEMDVVNQSPEAEGESDENYIVEESNNQDNVNQIRFELPSNILDELDNQIDDYYWEMVFEETRRQNLEYFNTLEDQQNDDNEPEEGYIINDGDSDEDDDAQENNYQQEEEGGEEEEEEEEVFVEEGVYNEEEYYDNEYEGEEGDEYYEEDENQLNEDEEYNEEEDFYEEGEEENQSSNGSGISIDNNNNNSGSSSSRINFDNQEEELFTLLRYSSLQNYNGESFIDNVTRMDSNEIQNYFENLQYHPITQNYGCIGWFIYNQIKRAKLFRVEPGSKFFSQLLQFYITLSSNNSFTNPNSLINNQKFDYFFKCLIKLKDIKKMLENIRLSVKDLTPIKFTLDILEHHYRTNDSPTFTYYLNQLLPVLELFYSKISNDKLLMVNKHLDLVLSSIKDYRTIITIHEKKTIHLDYIKKQIWSYRNLVDLNSINEYYQ